MIAWLLETQSRVEAALHMLEKKVLFGVDQ